MDPASMPPLLGGVLIFCLRLTDVTLGTMRILMTVRGRKVFAALLGFVEVTIFVVAISQRRVVAATSLRPRLTPPH